MALKQCYFASLVIVLAAAVSCRAEFCVNTRTSKNQANPAIAVDANGNFVVVWSSYFTTGNRSNDIYGQRFDCEGVPIGSEFQINTETAGNQTEPAVAMDSNGNFVVAWHGPEAIGDANEDIFAQRYDANGQPLGNEFRVNTTTDNRQLCPEIAMNNTGCFVIVWESETLGGIPFEAWSIYCQIYDSNGQPIGAELKVNLLFQCRYPDVGMDGNGNFTIVWTQDDIYHTSNLIMARQYNANGTAKADPCQVSTTDFFSISHPSIAMDGSGHFMVTWEGDPCSAQLNDIHARRYHFNGSPLCEQFLVNTTTAGAQQYSKVAINSKREFVIVWSSESTPGSSERDIFGQRYDQWWRPIGDEFRANTYLVDDQKYPDVVLKETGEFVTVWQSYGQDGSGYGIFGQIGPRVGCADLSGDLFVNFRDFCVLAEEWLADGNSLNADLIDDNKIDELDLGALCEQWLRPCYDCNEVDLNSDNKIDFKDYALWAANWLKQGPNLTGDITSEGIVNMADLRAMVFHWAKTCE